MTPTFRFLEDVALADSAFEASGDTPSELFVASAQAVIETMVAPQTVRPRLKKAVTRHDQNLGELLFDWLSGIVYVKDAEGLVFREAACAVSNDPQQGTWHLHGTLTGEPIDPVRHELRADVKAVTKHLYEVRQDGTRWIATVVLDI